MLAVIINHAQVTDIPCLQNTYNMPFGPIDGSDVLENFDFDSFLHDDSGFDFDPGMTFGNGDGVETGVDGP